MELTVRINLMISFLSFGWIKEYLFYKVEVP
jgi:hypothetical protein